MSKIKKGGEGFIVINDKRVPVTVVATERNLARVEYAVSVIDEKCTDETVKTQTTVHISDVTEA